MEEEKVIIVENLHKSFGEKKVLKGLSLEVFRGETVVIIGRSGCGKSVFLKLIIGLLTPDSGKITILGKDTSSLNEREWEELRKKFGIVFQSSALLNSLTVAENVALPLVENTTLSKEEIQNRVRESSIW